LVPSQFDDTRRQHLAARSFRLPVHKRHSYQSGLQIARFANSARSRFGDDDIATKIGNHTFRATGITAYLKNGGTLERAAVMANHASTRTTQLYDRRHDDVSLDEVERIQFDFRT
jgi:integrase